MFLDGIELKTTDDQDIDDIITVEKNAFGYNKEANLVLELLEDKSAEPMLSLLAYHQGRAVGHILFTAVRIEGQPTSPLMHILAPLAVTPDYQRQGVGGLLINAGIQKLREMGSKAVFVLGHKEYYPRYGFQPDAGQLGFAAPFPITDKYRECWMMQVISPEGLTSGGGKIQCAEMLNKPQHWRDEVADKVTTENKYLQQIYETGMRVRL